MKAWLLLLPAAAIAGSFQAPAPKYADAVAVGDQAWLMGPTKMLVKSDREGDWSGDGRHFIVDIDATSLFIAPTNAGQPWRAQVVRADEAYWEASENGRFLIRYSSGFLPERKLFQASLESIDLASRTVKLLDQLTAKSEDELTVSWQFFAKSNLVMTQREGRHVLLNPITAQATPIPAVDRIRANKGLILTIDPAGKVFYVQRGEQPQYFVSALSVFQPRELTREQFQTARMAAAPNIVEPPLGVIKREMPEQGSGPGESFWLVPQPTTPSASSRVTNKSNGKAAKIFGDAEAAILSPTVTGVAFKTLGHWWIRPIEKTTIEKIEALRMEEVKTEAMNRGKQAAVAVLMYSSDFDDVLPTAKDFVDKVLPYVKNRDALNSFVYLLDGGNLTSIADPAGTEMGLVQTEFGTAVVYADGHVVWKPAKAVLDRIRRPISESQGRDSR